MKYAEYQVWFHAYNNAILAFGRRGDGGLTTVGDIIHYAEQVADKALERYQTVQMPEGPDMNGIDLQSLVDTVAKNVTSKKR